MGIADLISSQNIQLFPNPATDDFTLIYNGNAEIKAIYLTDMLGKRILTIADGIATTNFSRKMSVANLSNGIYMVCVISKSGTIAVKRIVVSR